MAYRLLSEKDSNEIQELWDYCFEKKESSFFKWYFEKSFQYERTLGVFDGNRLKSMLNLSPYMLKICGAQIPVSYIAGVATWPEYRGQGEAKKLLKDALAQMKEWNEPLALLMPSRPEFYYPMDFRLYNNHLRCEIPMDELRKLTTTSTLSFRPVLSNDIDALDNIFQKSFSGYEGNVIREEKNWNSWIESTKVEDGKGYLILKDGQSIGYVFFSLVEGKLHIQDWGATNQEARNGLLSFVYQHRAQAQKVQMDIPVDDPLVFLLPELKDRVSLVPFMSSRIVDVQKLVSLLKWKHEGEFIFEISDSVLEWNQGVFKLEAKNGIAQLLPTKEKPAFKITIGGLAQWLFGQMNSEMLQKAGFLEIYDEIGTQNFDLWWERKVTYINEYF